MPQGLWPEPLEGGSFHLLRMGDLRLERLGDKSVCFECGTSCRHPAVGVIAVDCVRLCETEFRGRKSRLEITAWCTGSGVLVNVYHPLEEVAVGGQEPA